MRLRGDGVWRGREREREKEDGEARPSRWRLECGRLEQSSREEGIGLWTVCGLWSVELECGLWTVERDCGLWRVATRD